MIDVEDLRAKLKKRRGKPGFKANVAELEQSIAFLESGPYRDKETGQFVSIDFALANPDLVEKEGA